jgi:cell division protein FtsW
MLKSDSDIPVATGEPAYTASGRNSHAEGTAGRLLLMIVVLLMCIGIAVVYSSGAGWAEKKFSDPQYFLWRQLTFVGAGLVLILIVANIDYHFFMKISKVLLFVSMALLFLLLVLHAAGVIKGAARWLGYGPLKFQASDLAKYAIIFHFSRLITLKQEYIKDLKDSYYPLLSLLLSVVALVALEPNFSTATLIALIGFSLMFVGGVSIKHLLTTLLALAPVAVLFVYAASYRARRLTSFLGADEKLQSYQVSQALLGLGNGGLFGLGVGASKQRELYLPLSYNDFVFVVVGEEYGFIGALVILLLFAGFFICGIIISRNAPDAFGRYVAAGITISIVLFAFINIAVASHLLPTTGVALPFISYGGTAMLFNSLGVGILFSISRHKKKLESMVTAQPLVIAEGDGQ